MRREKAKGKRKEVPLSIFHLSFVIFHLPFAIKWLACFTMTGDK
jgi:hypothetical protein